MAKKKTTKKRRAKAPKKKTSRVGRQRGAPPADMKRMSAERKRQGKLGGRPKGLTSAKKDLDAAIKERAAKGVQPEDIARVLGLEKRIAEEPGFRAHFDRLVEIGESQLREVLATKLCDEAMKGGVTALKEMGEAWLERHMDEAPLRDFAAGTPDRILSVIEKAKKARKNRREAARQ